MRSMDDFHGLRDRVVLLTGAAGLYGRALTEALVRAGCRLILASRNLAALRATAEPFSRGAADIQIMRFDQGSEKSILHLRDNILTTYGRLDGLVNNSALRPMLSLGDATEKWNESLKVNATGVFLMSRIFGDVMAEKRIGSVVNIGSIYGLLGPTLAFYHGTDMEVPPDYFFHKGGMLNLTRYFAAIYGGKGVRFNYIAAGGALHEQPKQFRKRYEQATFLGRMAYPAELGGPVIFLLGEASSYVTGASLAVDGGFSAH